MLATIVLLAMKVLRGKKNIYEKNLFNLTVSTACAVSYLNLESSIGNI